MSEQMDRAREASELVERLTPMLTSLRPKESQFVEDMAARLEEFGEKAFVSVKQIAWLRDLEQR